MGSSHLEASLCSQILQNTILPLWDVGGCHPHSELDADLTVFVSVQRVALCLKQLMSKGCLDAAALANVAPCTGDGCRLAALEPDCKVHKPGPSVPSWSGCLFPPPDTWTV